MDKKSILFRLLELLLFAIFAPIILILFLLFKIGSCFMYVKDFYDWITYDVIQGRLLKVR